MKKFSPAKFSVLAFFLFPIIFGGCFSRHLNENIVAQPEQTEQSAEKTFDVSAANINLSAPLVVSQKPEDKTLCSNINRTIDESKFSNSRWGILVASLKDGRIICEREGRKLFTPASIQKTLTAIVALEKLGADFRWETSVYVENAINANGITDGNLILYGQGAPDFDDAALENLAAQIVQKGLKKVTGNIVADTSFFRGDMLGDGWTWNELQWYYGAEASAITFNENQTTVSIENGSGSANTDFVNVTVSNAASENSNVAGLKRGLENNDVYVWGNTKNFGKARVAVHNPAELAAKRFKEILQKKGIAVEGKTLTRDWKSPDKTETAKAQKVASIESRTLGEIIRKMNKDSVNLYAELILRTLGKKFGDTVPGEEKLPQSLRGDDISGAMFVKKFLTEIGAATDEVEIHDGSGLSRLDFVTPETFAKSYIYAAQSKFSQTFADSLPIAATDGTLRGRLAMAKGKISAKTGSISYVNTLAGFAKTNGGETFAFAIICNNELRKQNSAVVIDEIANALANYK